MELMIHYRYFELLSELHVILLPVHYIHLLYGFHLFRYFDFLDTYVKVSTAKEILHMDTSLLTAVDNDSCYGFTDTIPIVPEPPCFPVKLSWKNLSFELTEKKWWKCKSVRKTVLSNVNGEISGNSMTALMGPSGSGKSTLLNCISGRLNKGMTGEIVLESHANDTQAIMQNFVIGFVPQTDNLFLLFTVSETLMFASRLNNPSLSTAEHRIKVQQVLLQLDLVSESQSKLSSLSGGQLKRASIASVLITNPLILLLDEPTSALDSDNSEKVISVLQNLSLVSGSESPAILATIHQPSPDVFALFDSIYLLSKFGRNLYHGPPDRIMPFLNSFGLTCRPSVNPAEFMISVANAKFGQESLDRMTETTENTPQSQGTQRFLDNSAYSLTPSLININGDSQLQLVHSDSVVNNLDSVRKKPPARFWQQVWLLFLRGFQANFTKGYTFLANSLMGVVTAIFMCSVKSVPFGQVPLCHTNDPVKASTDVYEATSFYFMLIFYFIFTFGMSGVTVFPRELKVIVKEMSNSWFSLTAYCVSKVLIDFILMASSTLPMLLYLYLVSQQPKDRADRFFLLYFFCFSLGFLWESRAQLFCIIFPDSSVAMAVTIGLMFPLTFVSGIYVKHFNMASFYKPLACFSDYKYGYEGAVLAMYGHRCNPIGLGQQHGMYDTWWDSIKECFSEEATSKYPSEGSLMLSAFQINMDQILRNIAFFVLVCFITKISVFLALRVRTRSNIRM